MDMTNFTFSEDDDSLQSQTLKANIQQISRQLILDSTRSPLTITMDTTRPLVATANSSPLSRPIPIQGGNPVTPTLLFPIICFAPSPLSPFTPPSIFTYPDRSGAETPVLAPPAQFRDASSDDIEDEHDEQDEPFDLTTDRALDLRMLSSDQETEIKPLALIKPKEEISLSNISTESHPSNILITKTKLTTSFTCTSLDETIFYPCSDNTSSIRKEYVAEASVDNSSAVASEKTSSTITNDKQTSTSEPENMNRFVTGLDTIKQSYTPSADDTSDGTSTTAIIDDAFQYLKDIADETQPENEEKQSQFSFNPTESAKADNQNLNQTYDVSVLVLARKPPTGLNHNKCVADNRNTNLNTTVSKDHDKKEEEMGNLNEECELGTSTNESSHNVTFSDSSSFTIVTSLESDATKSMWSIKQAVSSLATSNLTLTLTKTNSPSAPTFIDDSPKNSGCNTQDLQENLNSTPNSRIVIGSNNTIEESTIVKEASEVVSYSQHSTVVSHAATPDVSLCHSNQEPVQRGCSANIADILSSTRREIRKQPIGSEITPQPKPKEESLRKKVMKKAVSTKPLPTNSDSVLNIAFRQDNKKTTPVKRKKKSLLKTLKKQLLCNNASNVSQFSQHDQTVTATCLGRVVNSTKPNKKHSPKFFPKCTENVNNSCATTSFVTLDRSSYSTPMPAWCKQILSTTEATSRPIPTSTPLRDSNNPTNPFTRASQSIGVSTSSLPHLNQDSPAQRPQRPNLFDSVGSWLSQIDSYHTPTTNHSTKSISTTTQESPQEQLPIQKKYDSKPDSNKYDCPKTPTQVANDTSRPKASNPIAPRPVASGSITAVSDTQQANQIEQWKPLSPCHYSQMDLISHVGRLTAEWLTMFIMDNSMETFQSYFDVQPNRSVLLELCDMCNIKVKTTSVHPDMLVLIKTRYSRAPTETDLKRLIRATRR